MDGLQLLPLLQGNHLPLHLELLLLTDAQQLLLVQRVVERVGLGGRPRLSGGESPVGSTRPLVMVVMMEVVRVRVMGVSRGPPGGRWNSQGHSEAGLTATGCAWSST